MIGKRFFRRETPNNTGCTLCHKQGGLCIAKVCSGMMLFVVDIQLTFKLMNVILTLAGVEIRGSF